MQSRLWRTFPKQENNKHSVKVLVHENSIDVTRFSLVNECQLEWLNQSDCIICNSNRL